MKKRFLRLALVSIGLASVMPTAVGLASQRSETSEATTEMQAPALEIPADWHDMSTLDQYQWLVESIYLARNQGQFLDIDHLSQMLDLDFDQEPFNDDLDHYTLSKDDQDYEATVTLAIDSEGQILEGLAQVDLKLDETAVIDQESFEEAGQVLRDYYANKEYVDLEDLPDAFGQANRISYLQDLTLYHYQGESETQEIVVSLRDDKVLSLNFTNNDPALYVVAIDLEKSQLDVMSHTAGLTWQEMVNKLGQPMAINFDSGNGQISLAWYSDQPDSVQEVYYYLAYDGIAIGLAYQ